MDALAEQLPLPVILAVSAKGNVRSLPAFSHVRVTPVGHKTGILWEQLELSAFIRREHGLGLHFCNAVPLLGPAGIAAVHDIAYKVDQEFSATGYHKLVRVWHLLQQRVSTKKSLAVLTVSEFSKGQMCETYHIPPEKVTVVHSGWQHFQDGTHGSPEAGAALPAGLLPRQYYYCMATLAKHKNLPWVIEAARANPNAVFAIAGLMDVKKHAVSLSEGDSPKNIRYLGYVSDAQAKLLMKNCKAFLFPSLYEGFGLPPLEALSFGVPAICSTAASLPEIYKDAVHYIDPFDAHVDLDALLEQPVAPPETLLSLYSWRHTAEKIVRVVRAVCEGAR